MGGRDWGCPPSPVWELMNCSTLKWVGVDFRQGYYLRLNADPFRAVEGIEISS